MAPKYPVNQADFIYDDDWQEREDMLFIQVLIEQQSQNNFAPNRVNAHAVLIAMDTVNKEFNKQFSYDYCHEMLEMLEKWYRTFYWVIRKHGVRYDIINNKVNAPDYVWEEIFEANQFGIAYHEKGDPCWMELCQLFGTLFNPANEDVINISSGTETDDIGNMSGLPEPVGESADVVNISSSSWSTRDESFWRYLSRFAGGNDSGSESSVNQPTPSTSDQGYLQWGHPWPSPTRIPRQRQPRTPRPFVPSPSKSADTSGSSCKPNE